MSAKAKLVKKRGGNRVVSESTENVSIKNEAPPAKKRRGRPPKSANSKIEAWLAEPEDMKTAGNANPVKGEPETTVTKGRGRPPKAKLTNAADLKKAAEDVDQKRDLPSKPKDTGTPAKKGRPKKVQNVSEPRIKSAVKRGRGRPKKITADTENKKEAVAKAKREQPKKGKQESSKSEQKYVPEGKEIGSKTRNTQKVDTKTRVTRDKLKLSVEHCTS